MRIVVIIMNPELEKSILELLNGEYKDQILRNIRGRVPTLIIDHQKLSGEAKKDIGSSYTNQIGTNGINALLRSVYNSVARDNGIELNFDGVTLMFTNVSPQRKLRELTSDDINKFIRVNGVIISVTSPHSVVTRAAFICKKCNEMLLVDQIGNEITTPSRCGCGSKKGFILSEPDSVWEDYQEIVIQENPEEVVMGVVPRTIRGKLMGDNYIDSCKPGDMVDLSCALLPDISKRKDRVFSWFLLLNYVNVLNKEGYMERISEDRKYELLALATNPDIDKIIINSIFPSIYGRWDEKQGLTSAVFGGVDRKKPDITQRGTINVGLIGDPSTGKTRMLQAIANAAPKAIYTSGTGSTGVGLTAAVVQDQLGWRLEAGAVVLADRGVLCLDEAEKLDDEERGKIHEAMSKQTVSINKATIHTTLNARTTFLMAANPTKGRYNEFEFLTDNIDLPPTLLSRLDLIFIMRDKPDEAEDRAMAEKIFDVDEEETELLDTTTVKDYISYARTINPTMTREAIDKILSFYIPMRMKSATVVNSPIAITPRQLEGLRRLSEASARMFLKDRVDVEDAERAIRLMERSLNTAGFDPITGQVDADIFTGIPKSLTDKQRLLLKLLENRDEVDLEEIVAEAEQRGMDRSETIKLVRKLHQDGSLFEPRHNVYKRMTA